ncbi:MAG: hypothetical protein U9N34_05955 [Candidatus Cloacimonadota bacterium]|nr:hypothetical protein [Candidatus Cloacimonadota bacterium]
MRINREIEPNLQAVMQTANKAGFNTIRLIHKGGCPVNSSADFICYSFKELLDIIVEFYLFV